MEGSTDLVTRNSHFSSRKPSKLIICFPAGKSVNFAMALRCSLLSVIFFLLLAICSVQTAKIGKKLLGEHGILNLFLSSHQEVQPQWCRWPRAIWEGSECR